MIDLSLLPLANTLMLASTGLVVGRFAGALHFTSLRWSVAGFAQGRVTLALAMQLARLAITGSVFVWLSSMGAFTVFGGVGGFLWARGVALALRGVAS
ncbi:ATP synthase subunit I [Pandoraea soli]|uniref:N-ATPase, AtpR subunit n=1 Tax=Pandoraea soli TaxID=2508293 RepID=A0ABY6VTT3_9BURK|nr:ATP synthase subunit I [Pandoraea soli]VVD87847.1 hypothetical protein PSO31014_01449 [Pandoraea soli]